MGYIGDARRSKHARTFSSRGTSRKRGRARRAEIAGPAIGAEDASTTWTPRSRATRRRWYRPCPGGGHAMTHQEPCSLTTWTPRSRATRRRWYRPCPGCGHAMTHQEPCSLSIHLEEPRSGWGCRERGSNSGMRLQSDTESSAHQTGRGSRLAERKNSNRQMIPYPFIKG